MSRLCAKESVTWCTISKIEFNRLCQSFEQMKYFKSKMQYQIALTARYPSRI